MSETILADGFVFKRPREGAPDFVKGSLSIKAEEAIAFINRHQSNGWVNLDLLKSKDKPVLYLKLNTWKKEIPDEKETDPAKISELKALKAQPAERQKHPGDKIPW